MRLVALAIFLSASASPMLAQAPSALDSVIPSYTRARFWTSAPPQSGWHEGYVIRVYPDNGKRCVGLYSDEMSGFAFLAAIDTLIVQPGSAPEVQPLVHAGQPLGVPNPGLPWRTLDLRALRAAEPGCEAASAH